MKHASMLRMLELACVLRMVVVVSSLKARHHDHYHDVHADVAADAPVSTAAAGLSALSGPGAVHVVLVNSYSDCNLTLGSPSVDTSGASFNFPPEYSKSMHWTCVQAGSMFSALQRRRGLHATLTNSDSEKFWDVIDKASTEHQHVAVLVWGHWNAIKLTSSQGFALAKTRGANLLWISAGEDVDAPGKKCDDGPSKYMQQYYVADALCLAQQFDILLTSLQERVDRIGRKLQSLPYSGGRVGFINGIAPDVLWDDARRLRLQAVASAQRPLRMLIDCGLRFMGGTHVQPDGTATNQSMRLNVLFNGIEEYHDANPQSPPIITTLLQCEDSRADINLREKLPLGKFYRLEASQDIYATVIKSSFEYSVLEEQMAGAAVLSVGGVVHHELFEPSESGRVACTSSQVREALQHWASQPSARRVHNWAQARFSADVAVDRLLQHISMSGRRSGG